MSAGICGTPRPEWNGRRDGKPEPGYCTVIRNVCPAGQEGFTADDIDALIMRSGSGILSELENLYSLRKFGKNFDEDSIGSIRLLEFKQSGLERLGYAQQGTFGTMDSCMCCTRYLGFYVISYDADCWRTDCPNVDGAGHEYTINGILIRLEALLDWMCWAPGAVEIESYNFTRPIPASGPPGVPEPLFAVIGRSK